MSRQGYFMEQICTIGAGLAYAVVTGALFYGLWTAEPGDRTVLGMIAPWIRVLLLFGCTVLLVQSLVRAAAVWVEAGRVAAAGGVLGAHAHHHHHAHDASCAHDHSHEHPHPHHSDAGGCSHDHPHNHDHLHDHGHEHSHTHSHNHDHGHDHSWSPWRYTVLILPLMLFILPFPWNDIILAVENKRANAHLGELHAGLRGVEDGYQPPLLLAPVGVTGPGHAAANGMLYAFLVDAAWEHSAAEPDERVELPQLELIARAEDRRKHWQGKIVEVQGLAFPHPQDSKIFQVLRFQMACCGNDARPIGVVCDSRKTLDEWKINRGQWVTVVGKLHFHTQPNGKTIAVIRVAKAKPTRPPANPYLN